LHGGRITLTSLTADDAPDNHGSKFTVSLPLGKDHLPAAHIETSPDDTGTARTARNYGKGIIDEAGHWPVPRAADGESRAQSDVGESDSGSGGSSSDSSKLDASTLFFVKSDKILLGGLGF
jgi:hypothetical protein